MTIVGGFIILSNMKLDIPLEDRIIIIGVGSQDKMTALTNYLKEHQGTNIFESDSTIEPLFNMAGYAIGYIKDSVKYKDGGYINGARFMAGRFKAVQCVGEINTDSWGYRTDTDADFIKEDRIRNNYNYAIFNCAGELITCTPEGTLKSVEDFTNVIQSWYGINDTELDLDDIIL